MVARQNGRRHGKNYIYRYLRLCVYYTYRYTSSIRWTNSNGKKKKKKERIEVAFCNLDRTAFQISARILLVNPIRIELRPFVTPHPSKLLSDRALITSFFSLLLLFLSLFLHHREINSIDVVCCPSVHGSSSRIDYFPRRETGASSPLDGDSRGPGGSDA